MQRQEGYYYIQKKETTSFQIAEYDHKKWYLIGHEEAFEDIDFFKIGQLIPSNEELESMQKEIADLKQQREDAHYDALERDEKRDL